MTKKDCYFVTSQTLSHQEHQLTFFFYLFLNTKKKHKILDTWLTEERLSAEHVQDVKGA